MNSSTLLLLVVCVCCGVTSTLAALGAPNPPSTGAFASGTYRNLFVEYGQSAADVTTKINNAWNSLFGGGSSSTIYYAVGTDMGYILDVSDNDVRTEGMSYGLMICVQLNQQATFDKIFKWMVTYMRFNNPTDPNWLYYNWQCNSDGSIKGSGPASDGETYIVTALIFAAARWGSSANFNYKTEYQNLLYKMLHVPSNNQGVTNLFDASSHQVTFCPSGTAATYTDPSYHTAAFYGVWAKVANTSADQTFWTTAQSAARDYFQTAVNSLGLNPDYSTYAGGVYTGNSDHQYFGFDAWRTVTNIGVDYAWWAADSREITTVNNVLNFFNSKGSYGNEYNLDGSVKSSTHSPGHVACNTAGALASNNNITWNFVKELWNMQIPTGTYRYYDGVLYILGLLHASGNFKIYLPSTTSTVAATSAAATTGAATTTHSTTAAATSAAATTAHPTTGSASTTGSSGACSTASITVSVTQSWSGTSPQGNLQLVVQNTGSREISKITVTFSTPISTVWGGIAAGSVSGQYVVTANVNAGSSVTVAGATFTGQTTAPGLTIVSIAC